MQVLDYIIKIRETQGTNAKLDLLKVAMIDETFQKVLFYTYNPFYNYYIRKLPKVIVGSLSVIGTFEAMFELLDDLRERRFTGNLAIEKVTNLLQHS
ncbi:MAG: hypothetical protein WC175_06145, partial [Candidatus Dojkabacteria bacterium]